MKKNVIFILLDSMDYGSLGKTEYRNSPTPFLDSIIEKSVSCTNMFSQASYTEGALINLLCGYDTLDYGGYLERFEKCPTTVFEALDQQGYDTFHQSASFIYNDSCYRGINNYYYGSLFYKNERSFKDIYVYRLEYYSKVYKNGDLTEKELNMLEKFIEDNLKLNINLIRSIKNDEECVRFYKEKVSKLDLDAYYNPIKAQYDIFLKDKKAFVIDIFEKGIKHPMFCMSCVDTSDMLNDDEFRKKIANEFSLLLADNHKINYRHNLRNTRVSLKRCRNIIMAKNGESKKKKLQTLKKYGGSIKGAFRDSEFSRTLVEEYKNDKLTKDLTLTTYINNFVEWEKTRDSKKPYVAYIHTDEPHYYPSLFSFDSKDEQLIGMDFNNIKNYTSNIPKNYRGSLSRDCNLVFCDNLVKRVFATLEKENMLDNTDVIITADHGYSYTKRVIREEVSNSVLFEENFHIPFIVYNKDCTPKKLDGFFCAKDIPATILDICGVTPPANFTGQSVLSAEEGREYAIMEFMGAGCPDYIRRPILFSIRNHDYMLSYSVKRDDPFESGTLMEIYDLKKDPEEYINLVNNTKKYDNKEIEKMIAILKERHSNIIK